ncbi:MAG: PEP-CTERM sorting domain-containing protein [Kiritimatiellae bacterium]|nr:PEP-CTERM sorting domain-containing protein [Kiritimatiellia bacterium]
MRPLSQLSLPHRIARAALFCAFALALPLAVQAAELEGSIILAMGTYDPSYQQYSSQMSASDGGLSFYTTSFDQGGLGFGEGSIVQIVAVTQEAYNQLADTSGNRGSAIADWASATGQSAGDYDYSTEDGTTYFANADDPNAVLDPRTTLEGQTIIMTTALDGNLEATFRFDYTELVNQGYVGFYLRVFSATNFAVAPDPPTSNVVWGASALYTFRNPQGGERADFSGLTIVGTNMFEIIPEPATTSLFFLGAAALLARRRRNPFRGGRAMNSKHFLLPVLLCTALFASGAARADVIHPVYLMPDSPVTDALGEPFPGTCNAGDGGLVEIREVGSGIVPPDPLTGKSDDEANPLLLTGHLGDNTLGRDSGLFTLAIADANARPALTVAYFARVFDAPDPADAVLYSDSEPFTLANYSSIRTTTRLFFGESQSVDPELDAYLDSDGDGYTDRTEAYLRSHDTDGDGWSDWFELTHGMDTTAKYEINIALEPVEEPDLAYAGVSSVDELTDEELDEIPWNATGTGISWTAVSGVTYVVDFASDLADPDGWVGILTNVAESSDGFADVSEFLSGATGGIGFFRVKAVPQPGEGPVDTGEE